MAALVFALYYGLTQQSRKAAAATESSTECSAQSYTFACSTIPVTVSSCFALAVAVSFVIAFTESISCNFNCAHTCDE